MTAGPLSPDVLNRIYAEAGDAYLAEHPEPKALDFRCAQCRVPAGQPCNHREPGRTHMTRHDKASRAARQRWAGADRAGMKAENEHYLRVTAAEADQ